MPLLYKSCMAQHARLSICIALVVIAQVAAHSARPLDQKSLHSEIAALDASMVAAFTRDPSSVAAFYTDDAAIIGGGQRYQGRAAVDEYWKMADEANEKHRQEWLAKREEKKRAKEAAPTQPD